MPRWTAVAVVVLVLGAASMGPAIAQDGGGFVRGEPDLDVYLPDPEVTPGTSAQVMLQISNDGRVDAGTATLRDTVTTARGATVTVTDGGPFAVETRRQAVGSIPDGSVKEVPVTLTIPEDVEPGEYIVDLRIRYSYTGQYSAGGGVVQDRSETLRTSVEVVVDDGPRFTVRTVESDVQAGGSGTINATVTNVGGAPARDVTVALESTSPDVTLGSGSRNTAWIGRLDAGENVTLPFDASVRADTATRNVTLAGSVSFTHPSGVDDTQDGLSVGFRPQRSQAFTVGVEESTLRVGEHGTVRGSVTNDGPAPVEDVVVSLGETGIDFRTRNYAVGDLAPGESGTFIFRGSVSPESAAAPRQITMTTSYRTTRGADATTTSPVRVDVAERRDAVAVSPVNATFATGETGTLDLDVTNRRDEPIRDVLVRVAVEDPLTVEFRTAVIPRLEPGESGRVAFDLEVDADAPESRYPATIAVNYTDANDRAATARPETVAIGVSSSETAIPAAEIVGVALVLLLVAGGGWWFYGRRFVPR